MGTVVDLLERPTYNHAQVDRVLGLNPGTACRWIDGYSRGGRFYDPVIREHSTGDLAVTWGEFVEARLLSEYRETGVPMINMRPVVVALREELKTNYPLASAQMWLSVSGRELVRRVQESVGLERRLSLVVVRTRQRVLDSDSGEAVWSPEAVHFSKSIDWTDGRDEKIAAQIRPMTGNTEVVINPLLSFGNPVVRGVPTEVIAELIRAGDPPDMIADLYELLRTVVDAAVRYEPSRRAA